MASPTPGTPAVQWPAPATPRAHRSRTRRLVVALVALVVVAGVITGVYLVTRGPTGLASELPAQIVQAAATAVKTASGFEMSGTGNFGSGLTGFDFKVRSNDIAGTMMLDGSGVTFEVLDGNAYYKAPAAFWTAQGLPSSLLGAYAGKWVEALAGSPTASAFSIGSITDIASTLENHGTLAAGGTGTVNGQPVVFVKDTSEGGTLAIATSGPAYPLRLSRTTGSSTAVITFSNWSTVLPFTPPPSPLVLPNS